ncbi:hypothetical protein F4780DRAFT_757603 [Xylariomycetidae sp. FL0641]|nr:hypothetical protein F4780DRAFT_757603 [Xylariomycetidae sp. FL0641]
MKSLDMGMRPEDDASEEYGEVTEGLLDSQEKPSRLKESQLRASSRKRSIFLHALVFTFYLISTIGFAVEHSRIRAKLRKQFLHSPANPAVEWSVQKLKMGEGKEGDFIGQPRPILEQSWDSLLAPMNVRLGREDIVAFDRQDVAAALSDGSGYAGTLNVFHELHCVRFLHKYVWKEHYWPDSDEHQRENEKEHADHCIETLRLASICHGDVGMVIYSWTPDSIKPGANGTAHQCVDWPKIDHWARDRALDMYSPGLLVHPKFGAVYPEGANKE